MLLRIVFLVISVSIFSFQGKKTIIFYGDSLTAGYGLAPEYAFPGIIEKTLNEDVKNYKVVNAGVSGETSSGGLTRINWILNQKVDVFVLELGANDGLRGIPPEKTYENLQEIVNRVKSKYPDCKILVVGMIMLFVCCRLSHTEHISWLCLVCGRIFTRYCVGDYVYAG